LEFPDQNSVDIMAILYIYTWNRYSEGLRAGLPGFGSRHSKIFSSQLPTGVCSPRRLLSNGYWGLFPRG
jgi:hypothetical protein